jgi:hypothetical protein
MRPIAALAVLLALCPAPSQAAVRSRRKSGTLNLRKRLHVSTLIAEPGTGEVDLGGLYSISNTTFGVPATLRFTPRGSHIAWGLTEFSASFDSLNSVTAASTSVLYDGDKFDFALSPQATVFLHDESGVRLGAAAIARYDTGKSSLGATASWTGATHSSATNPAGTLDLGCGFGRRLAAEGKLAKFTAHGNGVWERSTGQPGAILAFEGVEFELTDRVSVDLSGQHLGLRAGKPDHQVVLGITIGFGRTR